MLLNWNGRRRDKQIRLRVCLADTLTCYFEIIGINLNADAFTA